MAFSNLISRVIPSPNHYNGRGGYKLCKFTPHHAAGVYTAERLAKIFTPIVRNASCTYVIGNDGEMMGVVDEKDGPWTSSSYINDCQAVTVEVSNCEIGGQWRISDAAWNSLVKLAVDVCRRNNFRLFYDGTPNGSLTTHNMFAATACPGPYLRGRMPELARTVNSILDGKEPTPTPTPTPIPIPATPDYTGTITYQAFTNRWLPEVNKCDNTPDGYAGIGNEFITGFRCKPQFGEIIYEAHALNGAWLGEVNSKDYKSNDVDNGLSYAGIYGRPIDAIRIKSTKGYVDYRVKTKRGWLPWVRQYEDYAGNFGEPIIGIQMK